MEGVQFAHEYAHLFCPQCPDFIIDDIELKLIDVQVRYIITFYQIQIFFTFHTLVTFNQS